MKKWLKCGLLVFLSMLIWHTAGAQENRDELIRQMQQMLDKQQQQIEAQQRQIEEMKAKLDEMTVQEPSESKLAGLVRGVVGSRSEDVETKIYGQVNRGVLYANDGNEDKFYHVDNDASSTRIGFLGSAKLNEDFSVGTKIEVQFESNSSYDVSQVDPSTGPNNFTERHLDLFFRSNRFGTLSLGQGDTASNGTSEVDLSGTALAGYSLVSEMAGGIIWYNNDTDSLYDISTNPNSPNYVHVKNVFTNMDGLSRDDRLRYDTPSFGGFSLAASTSTDEQEDVALRFGNTFGSIKMAAAVAWADIASDSSVFDNQYNGSASFLHDSGLNLTVAAGMRESGVSNRDDATFYYGKLGYIADFISYGPTAFGVDYQRTNDLAQDGDEADSFGLLMVQSLKKVGTEIYAGYRWHNLDRTGVDLDSINAALVGARILF